MLESPQRIEVQKTLDVESVERELAKLWTEPMAEQELQNDEPLMRSRVANLLIFARDEVESAVHDTICELSEFHPCRALIMISVNRTSDSDIEMFVSAIRETGKQLRARHVCCEEITLKASGEFVLELPSATLPLLVPDLPVFLWWLDTLQLDNKVLRNLCRAADRLIIDSSDFQNSQIELQRLSSVFGRSDYETVALTDINWARLTSWRSLLASFYDVQKYREHLDRIDRVQIDYVPPATRSEDIAPQALLIAGWLASRLQWTIAAEGAAQRLAKTIRFRFRREDQVITLELNRVERPEMKTGRLAKVEINSGGQEGASFIVARSADALHLSTEARLKTDIYLGRVLPVRNRSTAQLLSREMEILCADEIYEQALAAAVNMLSAIQRSA